MQDETISRYLYTTQLKESKFFRLTLCHLMRDKIQDAKT